VSLIVNLTVKYWLDREGARMSYIDVAVSAGLRNVMEYLSVCPERT